MLRKYALAIITILFFFLLVNHNACCAPARNAVPGKTSKFSVKPVKKPEIQAIDPAYKREMLKEEDEEGRENVTELKDQPVDVIVVKGAIFTATARQIERGIKTAENDGAICIIQLDTPGGLVNSMRDIIQNMQSARVPVVVYVSPSGAMATSAGTYIAYAANISAMAPGTHIGSAHPVSIGQENKRRKTPSPFDFLKKGEEEPLKDESEKTKKDEQIDGSEEVDVGMEKATNAMVALIRSLAEKTGRNADWAEKAVRESVSVTATEAKKLGVIEIIAENMDDLLKQLEGRRVRLSDNKTVILHPSPENIKYIPMTAIERFLLTINDPQIALVLMFLGMMGLYFELSHPGATLPGVIGGICIILALYTLGSLPINYAALGLIFLSAILFIAELFTPTFGTLTVGGIIAFILGAVFLVPAGMPWLSISKTLIVSLALIMGCVSALILSLVIKTQRSKPVSGREELTGAEGTAREDLNPSGQVNLMGEIWNAESSEGFIRRGTRVRVEKSEGLKLFVVNAGSVKEERK